MYNRHTKQIRYQRQRKILMTWIRHIQNTHISGRLTIPITWDNLVTGQQRKNHSKIVENILIIISIKKKMHH